jgi:hypothetical protein
MSPTIPERRVKSARADERAIHGEGSDQVGGPAL